jgi:hypothetical protein
MNRNKLIVTALLLVSTLWGARAQEQSWSLDDCISYALSKNVDVVQSQLSSETSKLDLGQGGLYRIGQFWRSQPEQHDQFRVKRRNDPF